MKINKVSALSLKDDTFLYAISVFAERALSFFIIPLLTKTLSQELYAVWTQIIITSGLLVPVVLVGFSNATVRFLAGESDRTKISRIFHGMCAIIFSVLVFIGIYAFLFPFQLSALMFGTGSYFRLVYLFGFFLATEAFFELFIAFLRAQKEIRVISLYYFSKSLFRIVLLSLGIIFLRIDFIYIFFAIFIVQALMVVYIYLRHIFSEYGLFLGSMGIEWKNIIVFSLPLIPYGFLIWANNFIDRYFILHMLDIKQVSIYAVTYSLAGIIGVFYSILGFTIYPHIARAWNKGDKEKVKHTMHSAFKYYVFSIVPLIAVFTILHVPIIKMISTASYVSHWLVIFFLTLGIGVFGVYQLNIYLLLLKDKTMLNLFITMVAVAANVLLNLIMIPAFGIIGASVATLFSNSILAAWTTIEARKDIFYPFPWEHFQRIIFSAAVMSVFLIIIRDYVSLWNVATLLIVLSGAVVIYGIGDFIQKDSLLLGLRSAQ